ncbi:MAG TPA: ferritin-like domain-containing protein [Aggregatilineales bacterium]|nr:ferritin-like domain-containing protein [Aggregatilineales bacterium]
MKALIDALNRDLASEFQAVLMYTVYSARVTGVYRPQLVQFMQAEIPDELGHAQFLADKIAALGGIPTTEPAPVPPANNMKEMLENILAAEKDAIAGYSKRAEEAREAGEIGLSVHLETMIGDETAHYEETKKILVDWH